jgi:hypothetical protein
MAVIAVVLIAAIAEAAAHGDNSILRAIRVSPIRAFALLRAFRA